MVSVEAISFKDSVIIVKSKVKARNPLLLLGLPGIGFVSKLAADHLTKSGGAEHFATLYSPHFPNQVIAGRSGKLRPFSMKFFLRKGKGRDLIILKGDLQPLTVEGQYEVSAKILGFFQEFGGSEVLAMAGYALNKRVETPAIYVTSTSKELFEQFLKLGAKKSENPVPIVGMAGIVPALSPLYKMRGACLLVETPGTVIDAQGAIALLSLLSKYVGEKIDATNLQERARRAQKMLEKFEKQAMKPPTASGQAAGEGLFRDDLSYIR